MRPLTQTFGFASITLALQYGIEGLIGTLWAVETR